MIYTLTLNPALDYIVNVNDFALHQTNRTSSEKISAGGKGINVALMLKNLGLDSVALGFLAGFSGNKIDEDLEATGLRTDFIYVDQGFTRINVKLTNYDGTEINGEGPSIRTTDIQKLYAKLDNLQDGDFLVMSGSVPKSCPQSIYFDIMNRLKNKKIRFIVDTSGEPLRCVLPAKPFLIKPNADELADFFGVKISSNADVEKFARKLHDLGAQNVLVSLGKDGAVLIDACNNVHKEDAPKGNLVNSVGAGDSMIAGFIYAYRMGTESMAHFYDQALK